MYLTQLPACIQGAKLSSPAIWQNGVGEIELLMKIQSVSTQSHKSKIRWSKRPREREFKLERMRKGRFISSTSLLIGKSLKVPS